MQICANLLEGELLKIGRILSTRWVAISFRSVLAVWENYEVLVQHFEEAKLDSTRDKKINAYMKACIEKLLLLIFY